MKILNLKLMMLLEYLNIKTLLFQINPKKLLLLQKERILLLGHMLLVILKAKKFLELQKTFQQEFRVEKVLKKKGDKLYVKMERL